VLLKFLEVIDCMERKGRILAHPAKRIGPFTEIGNTRETQSVLLCRNAKVYVETDVSVCK
jgi:hypothetical protein